MASSFKSLTVNDTGYFQYPDGTNSTRTSNTSTLVSSFTTVGTTSWTAPSNVTVIEVLVVAGGGGGGCGNGRAGGGGGGGVIYNSSYPVIPGNTYTVVVGAGGAGQTNGATIPTNNQGGNSQFDQLIALGGGQGGNGTPTANSTASVAGGSGGSGGGGGGTQNYSYNSPGGNGTSGQGYGGGTGVHIYGSWAGGGGGGGAGGPGGTATIDNAGNGGPGLTYNISGSSVVYGAGGGGAYFTGSSNYGVGGTGVGGANGNNTTTGGTGPANTGSGGGASGATTGPGGAGTAGIVIICYTLTASNTDPRGETRFNLATKAIESYNSNSKWKITPTENPTTEGLILYLDAARYSPSSNSTWVDLSPIGSNATLYGSPTYNPPNVTNNGNTAPSFSFDNSGSMYATATLTNPSGDWPHTIEIAVQFNNNASTWTSKRQLFFAGLGSTSQASACEIYNIATAGINWYFYANDVRYNTKDFLIANQWYIFTFVYQGGGSTQIQKQMYINGVYYPWDVQPSSVQLNINAGATIGIGRDTQRSLGYLDGKIGHIKVYNRPLNIQEVKANVNAHAPRYNIQVIPDATTPSMPVVQPGLAYHLDPGNIASYPKGTNTWFDLTGNYQGAFVNYPNYSDYGGGSMVFNGSNTSIAFTTAGPITSYPFTVSVWATNSSAWLPASGAFQELVNLSIAGQRVSMGAINNQSSGWPGSIGLFYGGTSHFTGPTPTLTASNQWHQITWVVYGSADTNHQVYLDGRLIVMTNNSGAHGGTAGWNIGSDSTSAEYWNGRIGQVLMYNRILSPQEVQQNFNSARHRYGI
jgi:hypothetical protein